MKSDVSCGRRLPVTAMCWPPTFAFFCLFWACATHPVEPAFVKTRPYTAPLSEHADPHGGFAYIDGEGEHRAHFREGRRGHLRVYHETLRDELWSVVNTTSPICACASHGTHRAFFGEWSVMDLNNNGRAETFFGFQRVCDSGLSCVELHVLEGRSLSRHSAQIRCLDDAPAPDVSIGGFYRGHASAVWVYLVSEACR